MSADLAGGGLDLAAPRIVRSMDGTDALDSHRKKKARTSTERMTWHGHGSHS
jgi:hypothetical protein